MAPVMRQRSSLLPLALAASAVTLVSLPLQEMRLLGFVTGAARPQQQVREPSRVVAFDGPAFTEATTQVADAKARLMDLLEDEMLAQEVLKVEGKPTRGRVDEAIVMLERLNPTEEPVYSLELDGTWNVKYSGSIAPGLLASPTRELALFLYGGFSLGNALSSFVNGAFGQNLGAKLGSKVLKIEAGRDVEATAEVEVAGQKQTLVYKAELMPLSARRMSEEVISLELPEPIGRQDAPVELRRSILVTYLDDEVMIVRDESGVPEVLIREPAAAAPAVMDTAAEAEAGKAKREAAEAEWAERKAEEAAAGNATTA